VTLKEINSIIEETYLVEDKMFSKLVIACTVGNRLHLAPIWLFIVGPSGSGKTEFLNMVKDCKWMIPISSMTPNTFASGQATKGKETSLLLQIPVKKGGILLLKDFTSMMSLHRDARTQIMGQFREVYDGAYLKRFGNGHIVSWKGQLGLLAGVTDVIYSSRELYSAMGERFIMYAPIVPDRAEVARRAMDNIRDMPARRKRISDAVKEYLDVDMDPIIENYRKNGPPDTPEELKDAVSKLAEFATRARSPVERDLFSRSKDITYAFMAEMPTRLAEQLVSVGIGLMVVNEMEGSGCVLLPEDKKLLHSITLDCIPPVRRHVLERLTAYYQTTCLAMAQDLKYPVDTVKKWLEDMTVLGVLNTKKLENGKDVWWMNTGYRALMAKYEGIEEQGEVLEEVAEPVDNNLPSFG
jgi:hypothetical protein